MSAFVGKVVRWQSGPNVLVGEATRYDSVDDELYLIVDGLIHAHVWVDASECTLEGR